jgi:hypothetical protein
LGSSVPFDSFLFRGHRWEDVRSTRLRRRAKTLPTYRPFQSVHVSPFRTSRTIPSPTKCPTPPPPSIKTDHFGLDIHDTDQKSPSHQQPREIPKQELQHSHTSPTTALHEKKTITHDAVTFPSLRAEHLLMAGTRTWPDSLHSPSCRCQRMGRGPPSFSRAGRARKILAGLLN